jgi:hypothetical protein
MSQGHKYDGLMLVCMDDAIYSNLHSYFREKLGLNLDEIKHGGGPKRIAERLPGYELDIDDIKLSLDKHHIKAVYLVAHENCGKYGGSVHFSEKGLEERKFHEVELQKAKRVILEHIPGVKIKLYFLRVTGKCYEVS